MTENDLKDIVRSYKLIHKKDSALNGFAEALYNVFINNSDVSVIIDKFMLRNAEKAARAVPNRSVNCFTCFQKRKGSVIEADNAAIPYIPQIANPS